MSPVNVCHYILRCSLFSVQLLRMFFRQQDELRRLKEELTSKDVRIRQLELELNNLKNVSPNNVWPRRLVAWQSCFCCSHFWPLINNLLSLPAFFFINHLCHNLIFNDPRDNTKTAGQNWNIAAVADVKVMETRRNVLTATCEIDEVVVWDQTELRVFRSISIQHI